MSVNHAQNAPRAIAFMLAGMLIIPMVDVFAKLLGQQSVHVVQMVWARFFFGAIVALPFVLQRTGAQGLRPSHPGLLTARAAFLISGTAFFFAGLHYLPIADTLALYFVQPILITAMSPLLLGERVGVRRWSMVFLGFIGVLIIIRPGFKELNPGIFLALAAGLCSAFYMIITRRMSGQIDAVATNFHTCLIGAIPLTITLPFFWNSGTAPQWGMLAGIGIIAVVSHVMIARAYDQAEASLISPLAYTEMINAVVFGWFFFGDFPDSYTFFGVAILIASAIYISVRERQLRKERPATQ
jgi:drug/metabolite transporter (DMT)-like permease